MKLVGRAVLVAMLQVMLPVAACAQAALSVSGNPGALAISTAVPGGPPEAVSDQTTSYNLTGITTTSRVVGRLSQSLPAGVTLKVTLAAPGGATSLGAVTLTTSDQNLVRLIPPGNYSGLAIRYELSAATSAGVTAVSNVEIMLTVLSDP